MIKIRNPKIWASAIRWNASIIMLGLLCNPVAMSEKLLESASNIPPSCRTDCESSYGVVLGVSPAGVEAYSNCNANCVIFEPYHFDEIYTGIKWQCVEYARRWLLREKGVVFGDVDIAADIWNIQHVEDPVSKNAVEFVSKVNGSAELPQRGDLLIYGKDYLSTGHVAVVIRIDREKKKILIAEQNYANKKWQNNYAREIPYVHSNERVWLLDSYLIGWKRVLQPKH